MDVYEGEEEKEEEEDERWKLLLGLLLGLLLVSCYRVVVKERKKKMASEGERWR